MIRKTVKINTIEKVKTFVKTVEKYSMDIDLAAGRYIIDAKSIMGIFSLNLFEPLAMTIHADNADELLNELKDFIID